VVETCVVRRGRRVGIGDLNRGVIEIDCPRTKVKATLLANGSTREDGPDR
jgi:hypothetical protein